MNIGARLRTGREAAGLSIGDVAAAIRVHRRFLTAIEENDWRALPPRPFGRGFVRAYAAHLGEHPEQTVREYFAQFAPPAAADPVLVADPPAHASSTEPPQSRSSPGFGKLSRRDQAIAVLAGVLVMALVTFAALRRPPVPAESSGGAVATAGTTAPGPAATIGAADARSPAKPAEGAILVQLEATAPAWVSATVDGRRVIYRTLQSGERATLRGRDDISVRVGNAGSIRWQVNGGPAEVMGAPGAVRSARIGAARAAAPQTSPDR